MNKLKYAVILLVVCVLSLAVGISLAGSIQKNKATDSNAISTTTTTESSTTIAEEKNRAPETAVNTTGSRPTPPETITPSEAKTISLKDAGFDSADVWDREVELDYERGNWIYEVSFEKNGTDYEYVIDAQSGKILHSEIDPY